MAIEDATLIRVPQIFQEHNQNCAIRFIDKIVEKFSFRISILRTDRGRELQARIHWQIENLGMLPMYIKPRTLQFNAFAERWIRSTAQNAWITFSYLMLLIDGAS